MGISIILAAADNDVIGLNGTMPWNQSADLARFKRLTIGHPIIVGRTTFTKTFGGRPLPGRKNIVITRNENFAAKGAQVAHSLQEALSVAANAGSPEVFVVGGSQIYEQALPIASKVYLTRVHAQPQGDTWFKFDPKGWRLVRREDHSMDANNQYDYSYEDYTRP